MLLYFLYSIISQGFFQVFSVFCVISGAGGGVLYRQPFRAIFSNAVSRAILPWA